MPDLSKLVADSLPRLPILVSCDGLSSVASSSSSRPETLEEDPDGVGSKWKLLPRFPILARGTCSVVNKERRRAPAVEGRGRSQADHAREWAVKKVASGADRRECELPFLTGAPKMVMCRICERYVYPGQEAHCCVRGCQEAYHVSCAMLRIGKHSLKEFKCPLHVCFLCKQSPGVKRCVRCPVAWHIKCAPWPGEMIPNTDDWLCWRHWDWRRENKD